MHVDLGIWTKLTRLVLFLFFIAGLLLVAVWYLPLIKQNERLRKQILVLDGQIHKEELASKQYKAAIEALRSDPKTVERLARERLGYARPGEIVVRFEEATTNVVYRR